MQYNKGGFSMIKRVVKNYIRKIRARRKNKEDEIKFIIGKALCFMQKQIKPTRLSDIEFKVFSQWGEDGIIEYLVSKLPIENYFFIEIGVENYDESNTRFLMMNRNWSGMIIDGSLDIQYLRMRDYYWKFDLHPVVAFVTKDNIVQIIRENLEKLNISTNIGLLSIDIDGMDYWILKEIINVIYPTIIVVEYNSLFGNNVPVTVPYYSDFVRSKYHYSNLYFGANLKAFKSLLKEREYIYIGSNSQNSNAFFVKEDLANRYLPELVESVKHQPFEISKIRESRDKFGRLTYLRANQAIKLIGDLKVLNLETNQEVPLRSVL